MKPKIIQQGAEAIILHSGDYVIKDRVSKGYRLPELDKKIIKRRTKSEAKLLAKASEVISSPKPTQTEFNKIKMPFIEGKKLSEHLEKLDYKTICKQIAENISKLHDKDIIHGDLTTSNMILSPKHKTTMSTKLKESSKENLGVLYFIDFGLGYISRKIEDKAVDLHLIKQALEAKHHSIFEDCWKIIAKTYCPKQGKQILERLTQVEARGRYKKAP